MTENKVEVLLSSLGEGNPIKQFVKRVFNTNDVGEYNDSDDEYDAINEAMNNVRILDSEGDIIRTTPNKANPNDKSIVVYGSTGVGKSSFINMILNGNFVETSLLCTGCTLESSGYSLNVGEDKWVFWDTVGLNERDDDLIRTGNTEAIKSLVKTIRKINYFCGGVHLVIFVFRDIRITQAFVQNLRLVKSLFKNVPILGIQTGLDGHGVKSFDDINKWWVDNHVVIEPFGFKDGISVCCILKRDLVGDTKKLFAYSRSSAITAIVSNILDEKALFQDSVYGVLRTISIMWGRFLMFMNLSDYLPSYNHDFEFVLTEIVSKEEARRITFEVVANDRSEVVTLTDLGHAFGEALNIDNFEFVSDSRKNSDADEKKN